MGDHSKFFPPSSMFRRISCPGSAVMEAKAAELYGDLSSEPAIIGRQCHLMVELNLTKGTRAKTWLGGSWVGEDNVERVITEEMVEYVTEALANVRRIMRRYPGAEIRVEHKLSSEGLELGDMKGTSDLIIDLYPEVLVILDHKFGMGENSPDSVQNYCYAAMSLEDPELFCAYKKVILVVNQPPRPVGGKTCREHVLQDQELLIYYNEVLVPAVQRILGGDETLVPSAEACKYCDARPFCPKVSEVALELMDTNVKELNPTPVITPEMVNEGYPQLAVLESWIKEFKAVAYKMAEKGELVDHKLVGGRNRRYWLDEKEAADLIEVNGHEAYTKKIISPAQAEKLPKMKKEVQGLIGKQQGAPVIAHVTDKRKAIETIEDKLKEAIENDTTGTTQE